MASKTIRPPPQTLKQAKKAYQKKPGATRGLSGTDLKCLERAALLQERADRIKKREEQKLINRRKKLEKEQKERETRRRMGIPEPNRLYLSPRQERLSQFVRGGGMNTLQGDQDSIADPSEDLEGPEQGLEDVLVDGDCLVEWALVRQPLQPTTPNRGRLHKDHSLCTSVEKTTSTQSEDWVAFFVSNSQIERELTGDELKALDKNTATTVAEEPDADLADRDATELLGCLATQDLDFDIDETEDFIPIEETLPMFKSDDDDSIEDSPTNLRSDDKGKRLRKFEGEDSIPAFTTQDFKSTDDELEKNQQDRKRKPSPEAQLRIKPPTGCPTTPETKGSAKPSKPVLGPVDYDAEDFGISSEDLLELASPTPHNPSKPSDQTILPLELRAEDFDLSEEDLEELGF